MENSNASSNAHKKFTHSKRKRVEDDDDDVIFVSELPAKRQFFRPWLDKPAATSSQPQKPAPSTSTATATATTTYHANMVRSQRPRLRSPKAQQRRDRNTLACLLSRRARVAKEVAMEQQYQQFIQQHNVTAEQQIRLNLYYVRALQHAMAATQTPLTSNCTRQPRPEQQKKPLTKRSD
ncbi:hypothetical protein KR093_008478 [Drosophila rubida]|uniref:Protein Mabiki n=1 Tax=Drosophila rubida TaxID=30044 RepID=A0AAD4K6Y2_9MUSC|nr:hypothetical protein KR093_008478 [Drosophila rubida]